MQVSYLGYETTTKEISVTNGDRLKVDFALEQQALATEEVVVLGVRAKNQAKALNQQLNSVNIQNIVAADQMGKFPDANATEAVQRLPGISIQRDQGEGRYIQIRGASPQMTSVTFNGERVPSPEGSVRQIALDAVPVDVLEAIEVSKAIAPDMDADAIGGAVNLVTKRAPDQATFTMEGAGGYAPIREDFSGGGIITYGRRLSDGKFGYLFSGSATRRNFGSDDLEPEYDLGDAGAADDALEELQVRHYTLWRARIGGTAMFDYRFSDHSSIYLNGIYSELQDLEQRRRLRHKVGDDELGFEHKSRREELQTLNMTFGGEHTLGSGPQIDYHLTWTRSQEDTPFDREIVFEQGDVSFAPDISDKDNIQANPAAGAVDGTYTFDSIGDASSITKNNDYVGALNLAMPYSLGEASGQFKVGVKYRYKNKDQNVTEDEFALVDGASDILLGQQIGQPFSNDGYNPGEYPYPSRITTQDEVDGFIGQFGSDLESEHNLEVFLEVFKVMPAADWHR